MPNDTPSRPEWTPENAGSEFTTTVMKGVEEGVNSAADPAARRRATRPVRDLAYYTEGVLAGNRTILAQAITLVESNLPIHAKLAQQVIAALLPHAGKSLRIGITGVPGAGKSTFIDQFGHFLCEQDKKVAVLAVDPSSTVSGGSVLGDKTRMEKLSIHPNSFIRPSATGGALGGVTRKSRETVVLCEAFGFDVILIETVGVGQSETTVRSMVDFFVLLMISGAGDELQGIKKGVIEIADALLINKADGDNLAAAKLARSEYSRALHYLTPATPGWKTEAYTCSALTGDGIPEFWALLEQFETEMKTSGQFKERRQQQRMAWAIRMVENHLQASFYDTPSVHAAIPEIQRSVADGSVTASAAAQKLLTHFYNDFDFAAAKAQLSGE